jgi:hypothetical protein
VLTQPLFKGDKMSRASLFILFSIMALTLLLGVPAIAQTQPEKWEYSPPYDEQIKQRREAASAKLRSEFKS